MKQCPQIYYSNWWERWIRIPETFERALRTRGAAEPALNRYHKFAVSSALTLLVCVLWAILHPYPGLALDAQLYAFQAIARVNTALAGDLYLQNASQDHYTIFTFLYAQAIRQMGVLTAALVIRMTCALVFYLALWCLGRALSNSETAWLVVAMFLITAGQYGSAHVFHISEDYLTARTVAETLVTVGLACHYFGLGIVGLTIAVAGLAFHPIMALPGVLLLICLRIPHRASLFGAVAGIIFAICIALTPLVVPTVGRLIAVVDADWLIVIRERAQFLFLNLWRLADWDLNARPFLSLAFTWLVIREDQIRKLCFAAFLIGMTGLVVAWIAGSIGPIAILLQGQAWRWVWITGLVSVLLLPPTLRQAWHDKSCGPLCVVLLIAAWTFESADPVTCTAFPMVLWAVRSHISNSMARLMRWTALAIAVALCAWATGSAWKIASTPLGPSGLQPAILQRTRNIFELGVPAVLLVWLAWQWLTQSRRLLSSLAASFAFLITLALILPWSVRPTARTGSVAEIKEFADWRQSIPPTSTVLIAPTKDAGGFVWFTLERPSYLSANQSAGVVFSRQTALEVRRRSEVLIPIEDPDWKILTLLSRPRDKNGKKRETTRPLTKASLLNICNDPELGFVAAPENVGFNPIRHEHAGAWKNWNLYDCDDVRASEKSL